MTAAAPAEWAAAACLGTSITAAAVGLWLFLIDAEVADFDPRRLLDTDAGARLLIEIVRAKAAVRDAALTVPALLMLLTAAPEGTS
ncbi:hypothetical protein ACIQ9J_01830 [Streptomyces sp. NPDC094153]|uniref:hypothetical protein n=1 Tax=Streptomyces sp. NPDC094153 TaxID=3366058 RepID=UPI003827A65C